VHFTRCVFAEWPLLRARLVRSRLGPWLALVTLGLVLVERFAPAPAPLTTTLDAGALGAALAVGYLAGSGADRRALSLLLIQPTSPAAVAWGRWLAASGGAALVVLAVGVLSAWTTGAVVASAGATLAGLVAAAAGTAWSLVLAWCGGNVLVGLWFVAIALFGHLSPATLLGVPQPGGLRLLAATALAVLPVPTHYRGAAWGDPTAVWHAAGWIGFGVLCAARLAYRLRSATR
jgi:hypothetical protein